MTNVQTDVDSPPWAPTEDDLPDSDGIPMDNERQVVQMNLLAQTAKQHFAGRDDVYVGANMFVYFSPDQVLTQDFRGPDVFVVTGTTKRERKSWVIWQEGKGPDVVIEILSDSTQRIDRTVKKEIYATRLRVPEYYWYDPFSGERAGFVLHGSEYLPLEPDARDRLHSRELGLCLVRWHGVVEEIEATWLRWATPEGILIRTAAEAEQSERKRAEVERERAEAERERADRAEQVNRQLAARLARYEQQYGPPPDGEA